MQEVIFNVGVSGSGKSTWTTNFIKNNPNYLRINRDDIRKTLVGDLNGYYQRKDLNIIENLVTNLEAYILVEALRKNYNIIMDNTHLKPSYIKDKLDLINHWSQALGREVSSKFKIFPINSKYILKDRISKRDSILEIDLGYIDKQIKSLPIVIDYINKNFKDQIINE